MPSAAGGAAVDAGKHPTPEQPIDYRLGGDGANFNQVISEAVEGLAQEMRGDFHYPEAYG